MRSLDECIKFIKDMGNTYTAVGDIRTGEWYNDILNYLKMVPKVFQYEINWIPVKDQLPDKVAPDLYEPVTFVTVKYSDNVSFVILNRIQYGVIEDKEFDNDKDEWVNGIGWRYYDKEMEEWGDYESTYDCEVIAWSRDHVKPYMEE